MNLIPILNRTLLHAHMELELDVLGVPGKVLKHELHSAKERKEKKNKNSSHKLPKQRLTSFWSQAILGVHSHRNCVKK